MDWDDTKKAIFNISDEQFTALDIWGTQSFEIELDANKLVHQYGFNNIRAVPSKVKFSIEDSGGTTLLKVATWIVNLTEFNLSHIITKEEWLEYHAPIFQYAWDQISTRNG